MCRSIKITDTKTTNVILKWSFVSTFLFVWRSTKRYYWIKSGRYESPAPILFSSVHTVISTTFWRIQLPERLACPSLGRIGTQFRAQLNLFEQHDIEGFRRGTSICPPLYWEISASRTADVHWENYISISFHIEWDIIVVTVFLPIISHSMWKEMET